MKYVRVGGPVGVSSSPPRSGPHVFSVVTIPFTRIVSTLLTADGPVRKIHWSEFARDQKGQSTDTTRRDETMTKIVKKTGQGQARKARYGKAQDKARHDRARQRQRQTRARPAFGRIYIAELRSAT